MEVIRKRSWGWTSKSKTNRDSPKKWAYFGFDATQPSSVAIKPARNGCWNCHDQNAAVEHSFVQFYPELLRVAKEKGTIKPSVHLESK